MSENAKDEGERIAKVMARAGIASRRESERLIEAGRVSVNGKVLKTPAFKVTSMDRIEFDGNPIGKKDRVRVWRYHKPNDLVVTHKDEKGRKTVFDALPKELGRVISVGRLDLTSEGLLLLTNDGELARALELPSTGWSRHYRARAFGQITQAQLDTLQKGIMIEGVPTGPILAVMEKQQRNNVWISVTIREGKNREVRRALNELGLEVNRLIRVSYGPFQLGTLKAGEVEEVKSRILADQVGHMVPIDTSPEAKAVQVAKAKAGMKPKAKKSAPKDAPRKKRRPQNRNKPKPGQAGYRGRFKGGKR